MVESPVVETPNWITVEEAASLLNLKEKTVREKCQKAELIYRTQRDKHQVNYFVSFKSLPEECQNKYLGLTTNSEEIEDCSYADAPSWSKYQADKYLKHIKAIALLRGKEIRDYIQEWNSKNADESISYPSLMKMRLRYKANGIAGLLSNYGNRANKTKVSDDLFDYFRNLYLDEGAPSLRSCWDMTLGYAMRNNPIFDKSKFPSYAAFKRRLNKEIPSQAIYMARNGQTAWNRKYGGYINRDYSTITCGKVWVSDHAQIDVAVLADGKVVFPWVTAWRDYKSGKWLGWLLQAGSPNSDHIFQTFYYAAQEYGLPKDVIIDNGKDYRCKDFAGGRKTIKITANKSRTISMLDMLKVSVSFALPYNAQTKPIERDFEKIKELLSKHCQGYRGGNVVERPEKLADEIKQNNILNFDEFKELFDNYIVNIINKRTLTGRFEGKYPDKIFNEEFKEKVVVSNQALKLFCMRTSRNYTVGRNGLQDRQLGITYWSDWMIHNTGLKVYLRRDPKNYKEAWAFKVDNDEFVGTATAVDAVAALHANEVSKEEFKTALEIKKRNIKLTKSYIKKTREISITEKYENLKTAYAQVEKEVNPPRVNVIANTPMDDAVRKKKEMEEYGKQDLSGLLSVTKQEKERTIYLFATEKKLAESANLESKGVVNG